MRIRNIVGTAAIAVLIGLMIISYAGKTSTYGNFSSSRKTNKDIHVVGEWVHRKEASYDASKDLFVFHLKDETGEIARVFFRDPMPVGFGESPKIVVIGKFQEDHFEADNILMKCPSKYTDDANSPEL